MKIISFCGLFSLIFPLSLNCSNFIICSADNNQEASGMNFSSSEIYEIDTPFQDSINTFEAVISLPKSINSNAGTILGSKGVVCGALNFDITANGVPRVYSIDLNKKETSISFDKCDVRSDSKVHLAITNDTVNKKMYCYLNGELKQTINSCISNYNYIKSSVLGGDWTSTNYNGDWREGQAKHEPEECLNTSYFKGTLYDVALYSDVRSQEQIKEDMISLNDYDKELFAHYELNEQTNYIVNKAGKKYNIYKRCRHLKEENIPELKDYEYSIAVVGDTQYTCTHYPEEYKKIFDNLRDHAANNKLKYVISMGDNCDQDTNDEWARVKEQYSTLDGIVGYAINVGNHESCGQINSYFSNTNYLSTLSGCFDGNRVENSYRFLNIGDVKYIIFTLEYGAGEDILKWAGDICDSFPNHKVICSTHGYLTYDGTTLDENDGDVPTKEGMPSTGEDIWNKFYSKHENIVLTLCGHINSEDVLVRQEKGDNGNLVTSMLVNTQSNDLYDKKIDPETGLYVSNCPLGMIYYLYFSKDGSHIQTRYYSPIQDQYLSYSNQREITLYDGEDFEQENMMHVIKDDNVKSITFEKDNYNVGDLVNFNVTIDDKYEISSILVNDQAILTSTDPNYSYCYFASDKDCVKMSTAIKLENKFKEVPDGKQVNFVLPIILICIGALLICGVVVLTIKIKPKKIKNK